MRLTLPIVVAAETCKDRLQVQTEGGREVQRRVRVYTLDAILAVGYRVRSPRGVMDRSRTGTVA